MGNPADIRALLWRGALLVLIVAAFLASSGRPASAAGDTYTCALTTAGGLKCWGWNGFGQLGDGTFANRTTPVDVTGLTSGVAGVSAGGRYSCALTTAGGLKCWGDNSLRQLGDGTTTDRTTPVDVVGFTSGAAALSTGKSHTCAVTTAGGVKCWGFNNTGQIGDGTTTDRPTPVDVVGFVVAAAPVPGLSRWGLVAMAGLMAALVLWRRRRAMGHERA